MSLPLFNSGDSRVLQGQWLLISGSYIHLLISGVVGKRAEVSLAISGYRDALLGEGACSAIEESVTVVTAL